MSEVEPQLVLHRKAKAHRESHEAHVVSPARALRQALARSAEKEFSLAIQVTSVQTEQLAQSAMMSAVDEQMLCIVLDGPFGQLGAVAFELPIVMAFVEKQTLGCVREAESAPRRATATDAALIAPFIDTLMRELARTLGRAEGTTLTTEGYSFGARLESKRHLQLIAEAREYHVLRAEIDVENGSKHGGLVLLLPVTIPTASNSYLQDEPDGKSALGAKAGAESSLECSLLRDGAIMEAAATLKAVLWREKLSLAAFSALKVGDCLTVPISAFEALQLEADARSEKIGPISLGQQSGMRAVQLRVSCDSPFEAQTLEQESVVEELLRSNDSTLADASPDDAMPPGSVIPDLSDLPGFEDFDPTAEPEDSEELLTNTGKAAML